MIDRSMSAFALETRFEFLRLARQPAYLVPLFAFPLAFYYLFGISMNATQQYHGAPVAVYMLATYGAFGVIGAALFGFGISLALERGSGWLVLRRASPMQLWSFLTAKLLAALAFSLAVALALQAMGVALGGVRIPVHTALELDGVLVAGAIPFCAMGFAVGMLAPPNGAAPIVNLLYLPMSFLGGLWIPAALLPKAFSSLVPWMPTYHFGRLALGVLGISHAGASDVLALAAWTVLFIAVAALGWRRDESRGNGE